MLSATYPFPALRLPDRPAAGRFLVAVFRARLGTVLGAALVGVVWALPGALLPLVIGQGIGAIAAHDGAAVWRWAVAAAVLGLVQTLFGTWMHFLNYGLWLHGAGTTQRAVSAHTTRVGAGLRESTTTGNLVAITTSDINHIGDTVEMIGRAFGSLIAFIVVAFWLLSTSPLLGVVALVGVPLAVLGIGPLLAPLQNRKSAQREQRGDVNALGADIVSGLRILRGIGGERRFLARFRETSQRVRRAGVEVGRAESWLTGAEIALPGLVTVAITWLGARLAVEGTIGVGQLVSFYGVSAFLVWPVSTATEAVSAITSGLVAARKVCGLLALRPKLADPESPVPLPEGPLDLLDTESGIRVAAGQLTVVDLGADGEAVADRLARFADPAEGQEVLIGGVRGGPGGAGRAAAAGGLRAQPGHLVLRRAARAADARAAECREHHRSAVRGRRRRHRRGAAQRRRRGDRRAWPRGVGRPAAAAEPGPRAGHRRRCPGPRRADVGGRRAHGGPHHRTDRRLRRGKTTVVFSQSPLWTHVADEVFTAKVVTV